VTLRFQVVFLPTAESTHKTKHEVGIEEFYTEVYSYQTLNDSNPRNLLILVTPQGVSVHQDVAGAGRVFIHEIDEEQKIHRHFLEAERSYHKV
jgi:hypothetical protein